MQIRNAEKILGVEDGQPWVSTVHSEIRAIPSRCEEMNSQLPESHAVLAYLEALKCSELSRGALTYLDDTDDPGFPKSFEEAQSRMYQILMTEVDRGRVRAPDSSNI
jgi:hypothetical protein